MLDVFNKEVEDIKEYKLLKLADWIYRCRNYIKVEDYENSNDPDAYQKAVESFCEEWKEHYNSNKDIYHSDLFKSAVMLNGVLYNSKLELKTRFKLKIIYKERTHEIDLTDRLYYSSIYDITESGVLKDLLEKYEKKVMDTYEEYLELFEKVKKSKNHRKDIKALIKFRVKKDISSFEIILKNDEFFIDMDISKLTSKDIEETYEASVEESDVDYQDILSELNDYWISKQQYYDYINSRNKDIQKKFYINLGFLLSLDYDHFEDLLAMHGFGILQSIEKADIILESCVSNGFSQFYTEFELLKNNEKSLKVRVFPNKKESMEIVTQYLSGDRSIPADTYYLALNYAVNKLSKFIKSKEDSLNSWKRRLLETRDTIRGYRIEIDNLHNFNAELNQKIRELNNKLEEIDKVDKKNPERILILKESNSLQKQKEKAVKNLEKLSQNMLPIELKKYKNCVQRIRKINKTKYLSGQYLFYENKDFDNKTLKQIKEIRTDLLKQKYKAEKEEKK